MKILEMFRQFRDTVATVDEDRSSALVAQAAQIKASVVPTVAAFQALAEIEEANTDIYEAQAGAFKAHLIGGVRKMEVDADVAETGVKVQRRYHISQERFAVVMEEQQQLATKYGQTLQGDRPSLGGSKQKQLSW